MVIPYRAPPVPSTADPDKRILRDRHIQIMAARGRMGLQRATGYARRDFVETATGRYKHLIGPKPHARTCPEQQGEAAIAVTLLDRTIRHAQPVAMRRR